MLARPRRGLNAEGDVGGCGPAPGGTSVIAAPERADALWANSRVDDGRVGGGEGETPNANLPQPVGQANLGPRGTSIGGLEDAPIDAAYIGCLPVRWVDGYIGEPAAERPTRLGPGMAAVDVCADGEFVETKFGIRPLQTEFEGADLDGIGVDERGDGVRVEVGLDERTLTHRSY